MNGQKSPGALAALGASEIDQLDGKVDPEDSLRGLIAQPLRLRANIPKKLVLHPKTTRAQSPPCSRALLWRQSSTINPKG
jgi:hypothetical protein